MRIIDYINNNENMPVRIAAQEDRDPWTAFRHKLWEGNLYDVPEKYRKIEVISEGWLIGAQINELTICEDDVYGICVSTDGNYAYFASVLEPSKPLSYKKNDYWENRVLNPDSLSFVIREAYNLDISANQRQYMLHHIKELETAWIAIEDQLSAEYREARYEEAIAALNAGGYGEDEANARLYRDIERFRPEKDPIVATEEDNNEWEMEL